MKRNLYFKVIRTIAMSIALLCAVSSFAQNNPWKMLYKLPATNAFYITNSGNMILADYQFDFSGGIYVSTDDGRTWTKNAIEDKNYNLFVENDDYVFTAGCAGYMARSADDGVTWEQIDYRAAVEPVLGENVEYTTCYAMTFHDGKLFVGDFGGGGVVYSEDNGTTWTATDITPFCYEAKDKQAIENIYNLVSYNGDLYAFGVYMVFKYLPEENSWEIIRGDSNFMAISTVYKGMLCTGRSVQNDGESIPFVETLNEEGVWGQLPRPEGTVDNNIRAMYADGDNLFIGMAMSGLYFTDNEGETWYTLNDGVPYNTGYFFTPMFFQSDEEYIYLIAYEPPYASTGNSGLYRLAKADLKVIDSPEDDNLPKAPVVTAEGISSSEIMLSWAPVETATSYNVYVKGELLGFLDDTVCVIQSLTHSTEYCFQVSAVNDFGESDVTEACAKTLGPTSEIASPVVVGFAVSTTEIQLEWEAVEGADCYYVYVEGQKVGKTEDLACVISGFTPNTEYCFQVSAVGEVGESLPSELVCVRTWGEGVDEVENVFNIYPNPVENQLFVETDARVEEISVYDTYGRQLTTDCGQQSINVSELNSGIYFVKVRTNDGEIVKRFIKK